MLRVEDVWVEEAERQPALIVAEVLQSFFETQHRCRTPDSPNVKHQRARATASRAKDELSVRALRCMR